MNVLDSQLVEGQLAALGYRFVPRPEEASVVLYNTCSVRAHAEQKVYSRLGEMRIRKADDPHLLVGVIGCMAEQGGEGLLRKYPQIDLLCGPGELDRLPMLLDNLVKTAGGGAEVALQGNAHRRSSTLAAAEDRLEMLDLSRSFSAEQHHGSAYVRITRGCNKFCTYCVVPTTRGAEVHRPPDNILEECRKLVDSGVVEITLLGQTVNHYRYEHGATVRFSGVQQPQVGRGPDVATAGEKVTTFADLLVRLHDALPSLHRLRFVTSFPRDFGTDILAAMQDCRRICRYLHLPVQSGSDRILTLMNRGYSIAMYDGLMARVREMLPDCQVATDIICGFPTESDDDHASTVALLKRHQFKNAFIFKYSSRPGTAAARRFSDDVPEDVKRSRNNDLLAVQSAISRSVHEAYVGRRVGVFVESLSSRARKSANGVDPSVHLGWEKPVESTQLAGRTEGDLIVLFEGSPDLIGRMVEVDVERAAALTLFGTMERSHA